MASAQKFQPFVEKLAEKAHNLGSDTLKLLLTLTAPVNTNGVKADLTEIAAGNGYSAGGNTLTVTTSAQSAGTYALAANQSAFTASGGAIANNRYPVAWNDTATNDELLIFWDYGSTLTLNDGDSLTVKFSNTNPGNVLILS